MSEWQTLIPVVALIIGWFLNELSQKIRSKRHHKAAIGKALADLLEIRHYLSVITTTLEEFNKRVDLPSQYMPYVIIAIDKFAPKPLGLQERYNAAVDLIAEEDPILAFKLRSKDKILDMFSNLRSKGTENIAITDYSLKISNILHSPMIKEIDAAIMDISWFYSIKVWFKSIAITKRKHTLGNEAEEIFTKLDQIIKRASDTEMPPQS